MCNRNFVDFQAEALSKFYPSFVNYFEKTKETIIRCDKSKPRFHAFLKVRLLINLLYRLFFIPA